MKYSVKLSLISTYRIRKILLANKNKLVIYQEFMTESQLDLEKILIHLYMEKPMLEYQINQLEILARMHQVLLDQRSIHGIYKIENQIFEIFRLKSKST